MRKISSILMTVLLGALCLTGCGSTDNNTAADRNVSSAAVSSTAADAESNVASDNEDSDLLSGKHHIKIKVKDYGTISVELDADVAPKGMEVVDKICEDTQVEDENGTVAAENQPVIKSIKVID